MAHHADSTRSLDSVANHLGRRVGEMARLLREIEDEAPLAFEAVAFRLGVAPHQARIWTRTERVIRRLSIDEGQVLKIGWPKLMLIAHVLDEENRDRLLALAQSQSFAVLREFMGPSSELH